MNWRFHVYTLSKPYAEKMKEMVDLLVEKTGLIARL